MQIWFHLDFKDQVEWAFQTTILHAAALETFIKGCSQKTDSKQILPKAVKGTFLVQ